jgi:hypothetical protein
MSGQITLLQAIREILRPELISYGPICLEERESRSACAPITLNKSGPAVVLKPDTSVRATCPTCRSPLPGAVNDRVFGLFSSQESGLTSTCDYIIFYQESGQLERRPLFVFLCELKSKNITGAGKQAENGRLLADHIIAMARHHRPVRAPDRILYRALIFSTKYAPSPKGRLLTVKCAYEAVSTRMPDLRLAYYACGASYPLSHFCA